MVDIRAKPREKPVWQEKGIRRVSERSPATAYVDARENSPQERIASSTSLARSVLTRSMIARLSAAATFENAIQTILDDVIALHGAEYGTLQLATGDELVIVAQRGFFQPFLTVFRRVSKDDGSVCGRALGQGQQIVIKDVEADEAFTPFRKIAAEAGYRAVQSTPLITSSGVLLGVVSTHFTVPHAPTAIEMQTLKEYGTAASDYVYSLLNGMELGAKAEQMSSKLYAGFL
jgi:GAF domain-containing protein